MELASSPINFIGAELHPGIMVLFHAHTAYSGEQLAERAAIIGP